MNPAYRVVCFDLDGTLLPMDIHVFLKRYFTAIERYVNDLGFDGATFMKALNAGTGAMMTHDDGRSNDEVFWGVLGEKLGMDVEPWKERLIAFYDGPYKEIGFDVVANPSARKAIETLLEKGYPLMLTTMPLFPRMAVEERLRWAGIDSTVFIRITDYENSSAAKPSARYWAENVAAAGVAASDVLMVGNDTGDDLSFEALGADCYLVTDWLLDPAERGLEGVRSSTMEGFAAWTETLPECAHPADAISDGSIPSADSERILREAALR